VSEATLSSLLAELRKAIGDDARRPRLIRTRYGLGYQFCGEAQTIGDGPEPPSRGDLAYRLVWGVRDIALERGENVIGRT
jgi:DNA-binding winged helix-turn-helix (wHTH) protein